MYILKSLKAFNHVIPELVHFFLGNVGLSVHGPDSVFILPLYLVVSCLSALSVLSEVIAQGLCELFDGIAELIKR